MRDQTAEMHKALASSVRRGGIVFSCSFKRTAIEWRGGRGRKVTWYKILWMHRDGGVVEEFDILSKRDIMFAESLIQISRCYPPRAELRLLCTE